VTAASASLVTAAVAADGVLATAGVGIITCQQNSNTINLLKMKLACITPTSLLSTT